MAEQEMMAQEQQMAMGPPPGAVLLHSAWNDFANLLIAYQGMATGVEDPRVAAVADRLLGTLEGTLTVVEQTYAYVYPDMPPLGLEEPEEGGDPSDGGDEEGSVEEPEGEDNPDQEAEGDHAEPDGDEGPPPEEGGAPPVQVANGGAQVMLPTDQLDPIAAGTTEADSVRDDPEPPPTPEEAFVGMSTSPGIDPYSDMPRTKSLPKQGVKASDHPRKDGITRLNSDVGTNELIDALNRVDGDTHQGRYPPHSNFPLPPDQEEETDEEYTRRTGNPPPPPPKTREEILSNKALNAAQLERLKKAKRESYEDDEEEDNADSEKTGKKDDGKKKKKKSKSDPWKRQPLAKKGASRNRWVNTKTGEVRYSPSKPTGRTVEKKSLPDDEDIFAAYQNDDEDFGVIEWEELLGDDPGVRRPEARDDYDDKSFDWNAPPEKSVYVPGHRRKWPGAGEKMAVRRPVSERVFNTFFRSQTDHRGQPRGDRIDWVNAAEGEAGNVPEPDRTDSINHGHGRIRARETQHTEVPPPVRDMMQDAAEVAEGVSWDDVDNALANHFLDEVDRENKYTRQGFMEQRKRDRQEEGLQSKSLCMTCHVSPCRCASLSTDPMLKAMGEQPKVPSGWDMVEGWDQETLDGMAENARRVVSEREDRAQKEGMSRDQARKNPPRPKMKSFDHEQTDWESALAAALEDELGGAGAADLIAALIQGENGDDYGTKDCPVVEEAMPGVGRTKVVRGRKGMPLTGVKMPVRHNQSDEAVRQFLNTPEDQRGDFNISYTPVGTIYGDGDDPYNLDEVDTYNYTSGRLSAHMPNSAYRGEMPPDVQDMIQDYQSGDSSVSPEMLRRAMSSVYGDDPTLSESGFIHETLKPTKPRKAKALPPLQRGSLTPEQAALQAELEAALAALPDEEDWDLMSLSNQPENRPGSPEAERYIARQRAGEFAWDGSRQPPDRDEARAGFGGNDNPTVMVRKPQR